MEPLAGASPHPAPSPAHDAVLAGGFAQKYLSGPPTFGRLLRARHVMAGFPDDSLQREFLVPPDSLQRECLSPLSGAIPLLFRKSSLLRTHCERDSAARYSGSWPRLPPQTARRGETPAGRAPNSVSPPCSPTHTARHPASRPLASPRKECGAIHDLDLPKWLAHLLSRSSWPPGQSQPASSAASPGPVSPGSPAPIAVRAPDR
jgi:hypothetical protein